MLTLQILKTKNLIFKKNVQDLTLNIHPALQYVPPPKGHRPPVDHQKMKFCLENNLQLKVN